jgi:DNA-binding NtrC family response regulator
MPHFSAGNAVEGTLMERPLATLVIDDDPVHLQIYGWVLKSAGFLPFPALAEGDSVRLPVGQTMDVAILDYRLSGKLKAVDAVKLIHATYPNIPIILLSDMYDISDDIVPYIATFVRKGQPEELISAVNKCALCNARANRPAPCAPARLKSLSPENSAISE